MLKHAEFVLLVILEANIMNRLPTKLRYMNASSLVNTFNVKLIGHRRSDYQ